MAHSIFLRRLFGASSIPITVAVGYSAIVFNFGIRSDPLPAESNQKVIKDNIVEPFTGIDFPKNRLCTGASESKCELVGTAVRCMLGQCQWTRARAYAVGLYVEKSDFLSQWRAASEQGSLPSESASEPSIEQDESSRWYRLLDADTPTNRTLVLLMDQDVKGEHIAHGFDRSLLKRVRAAQGGKKGPAKEALKEFTNVFRSQAMLAKGTEIQMVW
eukprot:CAMPEP_0196580298 /NCGR_PEP_ID=MMETSP1081-20130531/28358_1 /TAXON_ID=36882 /ORGANISM="Pyramimonas amylifera, Strain CCMP720" /LENGTH=215 /DNA_ID=CAMNT_0041900133 /DNA_START=144 /DNA_END=788 /DNA_ORIENTATION=+